jgi:sugar phosphate isomerase/epimerase
MVEKVGVNYLCIKDFHLPQDCTPEDVVAFHKKCAEHNVTGYGCGPIYMETAEAAQKAFEYTQRVGVKTLVGVPYKLIDKKRVENQELLEFINELVKKYDIKYAIHNHGPDMPELFPNAESCMKRIAQMDQRVGLCLDIGHEYRDGRCPVAAIMKYHDRIHDMHIKNVSDGSKQGRTIEMSRGKINIASVVKALRKVGYSGVCSLEYEKDNTAPLAGVAESIGYFKGVADAGRA